MPLLFRLGNVLFYYSPLVLFVLAWDLSLRLGLVAHSLSPTPGATFEALKVLIVSGELAIHAGASFFRQIVGLLLAVVIGTAVGIGMARIEPLRIILRPPITFLYPMPKSALIPVLLLWFGLGHASKVAAVFLGCLLPVVTSAYNGARGVEPQLVWSALSLGASRSRVLWKIILRAALPDILSGIRIAIAMSWLLLISAEMMISRNGLGFLISYSGETGDYATMFAGVVIVVAIGFASDRAFLWLMRRMLRYRELPG
jgi:NitT/TauT family transport system permease protein